MTSLSKVKITPGESKYQWTQTDESITVRLPMKNVLMKSIDVFISDLLLKISAQTIKYFAAVDFLHEVDYRNNKNKTQLIDSRLEIVLSKKVQGVHWNTLEKKLSK